ncbi:MAG: type II toxin-antitoxin system VapC family toxin [Euryarchaeota archaeon]|nr:type II toxin-antitoxin system VapC family toxin [Euryarchaeota archaeon]
MRFVDANVFLYAILKPKRQLTEQEKERKSKAKRIYKRINKGEEVVTSTTHLSEIANVLEDAVGLMYSIEFLENLLRKRNIKVEAVSYDDYLLAATQAKVNHISINDAIAYLTMAKKDITDIYSFDKYFDNLRITRVES